MARWTSVGMKKQRGSAEDTGRTKAQRWRGRMIMAAMQPPVASPLFFQRGHIHTKRIRKNSCSLEKYRKMAAATIWCDLNRISPPISRY